MKCPECQFENPADTRFCGNCGTKIKPIGDISLSHTKTAQIPARDIERGTTIAERYEVIEELGRGGMGNVYRVVDKKINEEVALKLLHPAVAAEEKTIERFKNELKLARKITHKNVCRMYDLNEEGGTPYITMEYVPGGDLKSIIKMTGQLNVGRAVSISKQICDGLAEAHNLGVVHRDLKSRNIMIDKEGNARIMDFGIARSLEAKGMTGDGIMVGTPEYMSPEQVKGEEADQRSDIYSLGIVLFEMLTGKTPFEGDTSLSIALKQKTEEPPNPQDFNAQIPEHLNRVILKCLEKDRKKRYQAADDLASELSSLEEEISTEERILPRKKTRVITPKKRLQTLRIGGFFVAAVILIISVYLIYNHFFLPEWKSSIAVLPFKDLTPQKDHEYLCFSIRNAVAEKLTQIDGMRVISENSIMSYKDTEKDTRTIGLELQVDVILVANLQVENGMIRINVALNSTKDGSQIWGDAFDKESQSHLEFQDEISNEIARQLRVELIAEKTDALKAKETSSDEAFEYFSKGWLYIEKNYKSSRSKEDFDMGMKMYERAIEEDPNYALVYWGVGCAYEARFIIDDDQNDYFSMIKNYRKAYEKNPNLAEANVGMGWVNFYAMDNDQAFEYFKKAYELKPHDSLINYDIGAFFRSIGLYGMAIKFYSNAIPFDPVNKALFRNLGNCAMFNGEYEKADTYYLKGLELDFDDLRLLSRRVELLILLKNLDEAESVLVRAEEINPDNRRIKRCRALLLAAKGEKEGSLGLIEGEDLYSSFTTRIYSLIGMTDDAIRNINVGIEEGFEKEFEYLYPYPFLKSNSCYDALRDDPRFKEILRKQKDAYEEIQKKYGKL